MDNYSASHEEIYKLNHIEQYLKKFLDDFPVYQNTIIGLKDESDYEL